MTVNKNIIGILDVRKLKIDKNCEEHAETAMTLLRQRLASVTSGKTEALEAAGFADDNDFVTFLDNFCLLETLIGDHSRTAIRILSESHQYLTLFKRTRCKVLIVDTAKELDRKMLRLWGNRDNLIEGLQLKPTFADYVLQLRRQLVHAGQIGDVNPQVCFDLKKQLEFSWGIPYASVGQIYQIAKGCERG